MSYIVIKVHRSNLEAVVVNTPGHIRHLFVTREIMQLSIDVVSLASTQACSHLLLLHEIVIYLRLNEDTRPSTFFFKEVNEYILCSYRPPNSNVLSQKMKKAVGKLQSDRLTQF